MNRKDIEEIAKMMLPMAESLNAGESKITIDYDEEWKFFYGFKRKTKRKSENGDKATVK